MKYELPFRLYFAGLLFEFENQEQLYAWAENVFLHARDRRELYDALMCDSTQAIIELCTAESKEKEADALIILKSLKAVADRWGKIYDPHKEIFRIEESAYKKLVI